MAEAPHPRCENAVPSSMILGMEMDHASMAAALVTVVAVHSLLLMILSSGPTYSSHWAHRLLCFGLSAVYLPLMSYVLSYLTTNLWSMDSDDQIWLLMSVVLVQFIKAKADMAALAVGAAASPAATDDDINSLKVRPSTESLIYSFWVAGLVVYNTFFSNDEGSHKNLILAMSPLWILGGCRMVQRYVAFQRATRPAALGRNVATRSAALGRNVQLIDGYMAQLQEEHLFVPVSSVTVPRLIVTGESSLDVEDNPLGCRVVHTALNDARSTMLITLDRIWSQSDPLLGQQRFRDLCLSFALFKCLRRRFAGCRLTEAGSTWAFRFVVHDGLLGRQDDHERIFTVVAGELAFARDFYYSHLPVACLGTLSAALHFLLSALILTYLAILLLITPLVIFWLDDVVEKENSTHIHNLQALAIVLAMVTACAEISEMVAGVRSSWTKMSIVGHYIRCNNRCAWGIFYCLLTRYKPRAHWKDEIRQIDLLIKQSKPVTKVSSEAKASLLRTLRSSGGHLSAGTTAVQRRSEAFQDITWACLGGELTATTEAILVWCIATSLFDTMSSSARASSPSSSDRAGNRVVVSSLSRYCTYLVAEAPHLLPDNAAWIKGRYKEVKEKIDATLLLRRNGGADNEGGRLYHHLIGSFGSESSHDVLRKGSRLAKQLVDKAGMQGSGEGEARARDDGAEAAVWELLAEFWSEMLLYLAPSDNVKGHIDVLQRGGELITLLWALLMHAGITSRPADPVPQV